MRKFKTVVATLATVDAIASAIATGKITKARTFFIAKGQAIHAPKLI